MTAESGDNMIRGRVLDPLGDEFESKSSFPPHPPPPPPSLPTPHLLLPMLNLVRGRRSFACRLERPVSAVAYAEDGAGGDRFVMAAEEKVTVHDSEDARIVYEMDCGKRVLSFGPAKSYYK